MLFSSWTLSSRSVNCDFFSFLSHAALSNCESHFTKISSRFFFQIRVKDKKGNLLAPKKNTMAGYKSGIKMEIKERHQLDIFDTCVFPSHDKLWRSVDKMLVKVGRSTTTHHEEVRPETMMKIYELLALLVKVLKAGGTDRYDALLAKLPVELHCSYHNLFQWGAIFILNMFEVRRGEEGMTFLEVAHFHEFTDEVWDFKYIRKMCQRRKKTTPWAPTLCHGVIPDMEFPSGFNPLEYFKTCLSLLPTEPHKQHHNIFLFPMGRQLSKKFNVHDPEQPLYEQNKKSKI